jgi:hypothetical protein
MKSRKKVKNLIVDGESGLFTEKYKEVIRKVVLRNEDFVKAVIGGYSRYMAEDAARFTKTVDDIEQEEISKSAPEYTEAEIGDLFEKIIKILFRLGRDAEQNAVITSQFLELVSLNCIEMKKQLTELTSALAAGDMTQEKLLEFTEKLEHEEKQFQKAVEKAKEMRIITSWWKRRLEDLKAGDLNERI